MMVIINQAFPLDVPSVRDVLLMIVTGMIQQKPIISWHRVCILMILFERWQIQNLACRDMSVRVSLRDLRVCVWQSTYNRFLTVHFTYVYCNLCLSIHCSKFSFVHSSMTSNRICNCICWILKIIYLQFYPMI